MGRIPAPPLPPSYTLDNHVTRAELAESLGWAKGWATIAAWTGGFLTVLLIPWGPPALLVYVVWALIGRWVLGIACDAALEAEDADEGFVFVAFLLSSPGALVGGVVVGGLYGLVCLALGCADGRLREHLKQRFIQGQKRRAMRRMGVDATPLPVEGMATTGERLPVVNYE